MKKINNNDLKEKIIKFIKFGIVGFINTMTSTFIYWGLVYIKINYMISTTIAYFVASIIGYYLNKNKVFKSQNKTSIIRYYIVYISSYFLNLGTMYLLIDILGISKYLAPILVLFVTVPYNFILSNFWVFKKGKKYNYSHTFAIVAYKESPYLEECINSVINQTIKSNVIICTSTKNNYIVNLSKKYKLKLFIREGKSDIQDDWNYAYNSTNTDLVTITHQDDIYENNYLEEIMKVANYYDDFKMIHTDYYPYKNGKKVIDKNSKIKIILKIPLRIRFLSKFKLFKVASLSFGNTVCCPSVTYNKKCIKGNPFTSNLKFGLDWDTFLKFAKEKGYYLYIPKKMICYRIHDAATTKEFIKDNKRIDEDILMFSKIWPKFIVKILMKGYVSSYDTYGKKDE